MKKQQKGGKQETLPGHIKVTYPPLHKPRTTVRHNNTTSSANKYGSFDAINTQGNVGKACITQDAKVKYY